MRRFDRIRGGLIGGFAYQCWVFVFLGGRFICTRCLVCNRGDGFLFGFGVTNLDVDGDAELISELRLDSRRLFGFGLRVFVGEGAQCFASGHKL